MITSVRHEKYGLVTYDENFWTGKKTVLFDGVALVKTQKNVFVYQDGEDSVSVSIVGNFVTGVNLLIGGETLRMTPAAKWYEIALSASIFALIMVWGNVEALFAILPVIGGGIGGGISGAAIVICMLAMKSTNNLALKLLIWLGCLVATFAICSVLFFALLPILV